MGSSKFRVVAASDVNAWGWDGARLAEELDVVRWETIAGLQERHRADPKLWGEVLVRHPQSWRIVSDRPQSVQGFWHFVSLNADTYERTKQGLLVSTDIKPDMLQDLTPGQHDIYLVSCCIVPTCRHMTVWLDLLNSFWTTLIELGERGVLVREICTNAFTRQGNLMARAAGLEYVGEHEVAGQIFAAKMQDLLRRPRVSQSVSRLVRRLCACYALDDRPR